MSIGGIGAALGGIGSGLSPARPGMETENAPAGGGAFGDLLNDLRSASQQADQGIQELAVGGSADLHDITLSMELESLSFDLAVQIRNKLVEAYQEIFRMQV